MIEATGVTYVFPGQGSQWVGMGQDLYQSSAAARAVFDQADEALGFSLSRLCFQGPEDELRLTINAQPAILTTSYACLMAARESQGLPPPAFVAGHSLGEYTALAAVNVLDFTTTVRLARERGRLMYEAGLVKPGSMAAVLGLDETILAEVCRETDTVIANYNCPGQLAISGDSANIDKAGEQAKTRGASRVIPLAVSGAFHSPLMHSAVDGMAEVLANISFKDPVVPIIANTTARPLTAAGEIKTELLNQLGQSVQWQGSVEYMIDNGVTTFIEIGPGKVLSGMIKRITKDANILNISDLTAIQNLT